MIIPSQENNDARFGGGPPVEPWDKKDYEVLPEIDLAPSRLKWSSMKLEFMSKHYQRLRDVSRYINPKRGFFEGYVPNWNAQIDHKLIISGVPRRCIRTLAAGLQSGLSSPGRPWWVEGLADRDMEKYKPAKEWLEIVRDVLMKIYSRAQLYKAFHNDYEELGQFGTGNFGIFEDFDNVVWARTYTAGEYYPSVDYKGNPNGCAKQFWKTIDNAVQEYGWQNCTKKTQDAYKGGQRDVYVLIYELCEPNTTLIDGRIGFEGKKFRQLTWEADAPPGKALARGGYNEFPYMINRWDTVTTADTMGVGPGDYAIGDVKSTYRLKKDLLLGIQKKVDPPVNISGNVQGHPNMNPGGITRSSSATPNPGATPAYQVDIDIKDGAEFLQSFYRDLYEEFYTDLFQSIMSMEPGQKTAEEIAKRYEEKLLLIGPVIERITTEMHVPTHDRVFACAYRAGLIPPPPPELQGQLLVPRYVSILAQAQQLIAKQANSQGLAYMGNMKAVYPEALDIVNPDEMARDELEALGVTERAIRSPEDVVEIRKARAKKQQEIEAKQDLMAATVAAKNLASAHSDVSAAAAATPAAGGA